MPTIWFWIGVSVAALLLRFALLPLAPRYGYLADHDDQVRWGIQAADEGVLTLYDHPPPRWNVQVWDGQKWVAARRQLDRVFCYPPLTAYLVGASGWVFNQTSRDRLINTTLARAVFSAWGIFGDFLLAAGCAAIVSHLGTPRAACWTYLFVLLAPPIWWNSAIWGQIDAIVLAPIVWMVWAMVRHRWILAGVLYGVAAMLKPQAMLLLPLWGFAGIVHRPMRNVLLGPIAAAAITAAISLPFLLHGGWNWFNASYTDNLLTAFPATTLKAFNLWYVDLLRCGSDDVTATLCGIAKDAWGKVLLCAALLAGLAYMVRAWGREPRALVLWAAWTLLVCVMLPTRVHERYLLLALPLLIAAAALWRPLWPGLIVLLIVAMAQVTWPLWLKVDAGAWERIERQATQSHAAWRATSGPQERYEVQSLSELLKRARQQYLADRTQTVPYEWGLTILALAGMVYMTVVMAVLKPGPAAQSAIVADHRAGREAGPARRS
jgi:hypothetical protein